jgi:TonB family protein
VSSATNIVQPEGEGSGTPRPNPVALEVMVSVTGAKASGEGGSRDLFSEETTTVLVFKDGAVIRLTAPVHAGQLLFLTNKKSNQEVVCQVLHTKSFKQMSSYVELKFTEERADYWDVAFPESKRTPEFKVVEQVRAEEVTAQAPEVGVSLHSAEDVDVLKGEVEVLRGQLEQLQKQLAEEAAAKATAETVTGDLAKKNEETAAMNFALPAEREDAETVPPAPTEEPQEKQKPELLMPAAPKNKDVVARAVIGMTLPVWRNEKSPEEQLLEEEAAADRRAAKAAGERIPEQASEEMLPKPALDFSQMPKGEAASAAGLGRASGAARGKARTIGLAAILALALAGAVWNGKWWTLFPIGKNEPVKRTGDVKRPVKASLPAEKSAVGATIAPGKAAASASIMNVGGLNGSSRAVGKDSGADEKSGAADSKTVESPAPASATESSQERGRKSGRGKSRGDADESAASAVSRDATSPVESVAADAPLVAAKLLKTANPVYPPDAMRSYITGDVKAEVVVEESGRVSKVTVISGPKALQAAAVDALKKYEYAPATQGGKAVESKMVEVVKFWFNP